MRRVAQALGLLDLLARVERVLDEDDAACDTRHLGHGCRDVCEVVRGDARDDGVEAAVGERDALGAGDHVRLHAGRRVERRHVQPRLAQPARHVAAARCDVERRFGALGQAPLDDAVEILALALLHRGAVGVGALRPDVRHRAPASSTARRAASSIVASGWRLGGEASSSSTRALLGVRPVEPHDDGLVDPHLVERLEDPARDLVAARDAAEDVEEDRLHLGIARDDLQRVHDALRVAAAAQVAEVRRPAARVRDHVQRGHDQAGAVAEDPDLAVELHVNHVLLARGALLGRIGVEVAHLGDVRMAVERVVVDRELRVERAHLALRRDDERVDLAEHRVGADERRVELLDDRGDLLLLARVVHAGAVDEPARLPRLEALRAGRRACARARPGSSPRPPRCPRRPAW